MSSSNSGSGDDELDPREVLLWLSAGIYVGCLGYIQLALGIKTQSANVVTGLVLVATAIIFIAIWIHADTVDKWLWVVFVIQPSALIPQKFGSWKRNWRVRNRNPHQQTPQETLSDILHWMIRKIAELSSQIAASIKTWVASNTATEESTQTDEDVTQTTDNDTENFDE